MSKQINDWQEKSTKNEKFRREMKDMMAQVNDPLEYRIHKWSDAVDKWKELATKAAIAEGNFKTWKAARKVSFVNAGRSLGLADALTEADKDYAHHWMIHNDAAIKAEAAKKEIDIAKAHWETERSNQVSLRQVK